METWLAEFLADEAHSGVWQFREPGGFPVWAYFRSHAAVERYRRFAGIAEPFHSRTTIGQLLAGRLREHARSLAALVASRRRFDAIFFTSVLLATPSPDDGSPIDRLHEGYFRQCDNPLILQLLHGGRFERYAAWQDNVFCFSTWLVVLRRLFELPALAAPLRRDDGPLLAALERMFAGLRSRARLGRELRRMRGALRYFQLFVGRLLDRLVTRRLAFLNDACGLGQNALLTFALHEHGYLVVEAQHGVINDNVFECQYPPQIDRSQVQAVLPDLMLTFGPQTAGDMPRLIGCRPVGHYYLWRLAEAQRRQLDEGRRHASSPAESLPREFLLVSQGSVTPWLTDVAEALAAAFPASRIVFKLHPGERLDAPRAARLAALGNVRTAHHENLYALLARADAVVGHSSLVLLEAAFFPGKRVFAAPNGFLPPGLAHEFTSVAELLAALHDPRRGLPALNVEAYWHRDWPGASAAAWREIGRRLAAGPALPPSARPKAA